MPSGIAFPSSILPPMRDSHVIDGEETREPFECEVGPPRRRRLVTVKPLIFRPQWHMTPAQYREFDKWFNDIIRGGELPFDVQLADSEGDLAWYTAVWVGEYDAEVVDDWYWQVRGVLRTLTAPFYDRPPGTDQLVGTQLSQFGASGALDVQKVLYGQSLVTANATGLLYTVLWASASVAEFSATGKLFARPFWASAEFEAVATGKLMDLGDPSLVLQFSADAYTEDDGDSVMLQFDDVTYLPPRVEPLP